MSLPGHIRRLQLVLLKASLVVIFIVASLARGRAQNADSLFRALYRHSGEDTTKVNLYMAAAFAVRYQHPDSLEILARKGIALADRLHFERGKADGIVTLALYWVITGDSTDRAISYCNESIRIYGKRNDSAAMANAFFILGTIRYNQTKFSPAIQYYLKAVRCYELAGNRSRTAVAIDNVGVCYSTQGEYTDALKYYFRSLRLREQLKDEGGTATCLGNIAQVYANLGDTTRAVTYIQRSIAMQERSGDNDAKMITYENAGGVYASIEDYGNALIQFNKALQIAELGGITSELNRIRVNAAEINTNMGNYDAAYELYKKCRENDREGAHGAAIDALVHRGLGRIYVHRGKVREGIKELERASAMFKENEMKNEYSECANNLSQAYAEISDYKKAYQYQSIYHAYMDTLRSRESAQAHKLHYEYQLQEQQDQIRLLEKDKALAQTRAEKQRFGTWSLIVGVLLLSVIIALLLRISRREARSKQLMMEQAARLQELNDFKTRIFSVLSHDLRGPISSLAVSLSMFDQEFITEKEFKELKPDLDQQLAAVTFLLENLLSWSKSHIAGADTVKREQLDLHEKAAQSIRLIQASAARKNITIANKTVSPTLAYGDKAKVDMIVRNLLSNAVKFTNPGGTITLSARTEDGHVALSVADTGIGMTDEQVNELFKPGTGNTYGTAGEKGVGLGLLLSYEFARAMGGNIVVKSKPGEGSTFTLILPEKN